MRAATRHGSSHSFARLTAAEETPATRTSSNRAFRRVLMSVSLKVLAQLHSHGIINDKYVTILLLLLLLCLCLHSFS